MNIRTNHTSRRKSGFTLVELLVSITILSIILFTLAKAIAYVSQLWVSGVGIVDNYTKARNILTVMDRDLQQMVLRPDMAAFADSTGLPACAFYTNVEGEVPSGGNLDGRSVSLVQYLLPSAQTTLGRVNYGMNYTVSQYTPQLGTAANPLPAAMTQLPASSATNTDTLATGVIMFQWQFIDGAGNIRTPPATSSPFNYQFAYDFTAPSAASNPRAIVVSVLVLNNAAYTLAVQTGKISTIQALFPASGLQPNPNNAAYAAETYSQYWNGILNPATGTFGANLPAPIRSGLQVFQRYIPLPVAAP